MKLYVNSAGEWFGRAAPGCREVEFPWDKKENIIAWLTQHRVMKQEASPAQDHFARKQAEALREAEARIWEFEEIVQKCDLPRLGVIAQNVAWRYAELAKNGGES